MEVPVFDDDGKRTDESFVFKKDEVLRDTSLEALAGSKTSCSGRWYPYCGNFLADCRWSGSRLTHDGIEGGRAWREGYRARN